MTDSIRNLIGYGQTPPHPQWPNQARLALNFVINIEEGAERNIMEGDLESENYLTELTSRQAMPGQRDFFSESIFEYGSRCGIWRLLDIFERRHIHITSWACGMALQKNPAVAQHLANQGHEIAGHGYRWFDYQDISQEVEQKHIEQTLAIIESFTGKKPWGWYTGRKSQHTRELLVAAGLRYDSDDYSDDLPFWQTVNRQPHLIIPYTFDVNDVKYYLMPGWMSGEDFLHYLQNTVHCLYREGATQPKMMTVALHGRISGHPGRAQIIERFLDFLQTYPDIWICTRQQIAEHWINTSPENQKGEHNV